MAITPDKVEHIRKSHVNMDVASRLETYIDVRLSDPTWLNDMRHGYDKHFYYQFSYPERISPQQIQDITFKYRTAGWGTVSIEVISIDNVRNLDPTRGKTIIKLYSTTRMEYLRSVESLFTREE